MSKNWGEGACRAFPSVAFSRPIMIEVFCNRFPLVTNNLLDMLDNTTFLRCKEANRELNNFIKNEKNIWLRIIRLYKGNIIGFEDSWKKTVEKNSVDNIKQLALATQFFFKKDYRFKNQWHPIFIVAAGGSYEFCKHVIEKTGENNPSIVNHINSIKSIKIATGYTALHFVAEHGLLDVAKLIIDTVEDKNPFDSNKMTPLHYAARRDDIAVYKIFMSNTENKMPETIWGLTPCHIAAFKGNLKVFELIIEHLLDKNPPTINGRNIGLTPLHLAAQEGHVSLCRLILRFAIDKNPQKEDSITPLHTAAYCGHLEVCKILVEEAPDKEPVTMGDGKTPALLAKENGHDKVVRYLIEYCTIY